MAALTFAGCASPGPVGDAPASPSASASSGRMLNESWEIEVSEVEVSGAGPPVAQGTGPNCLWIEGEELAVEEGAIIAEWDATTPNADEMELRLAPEGGGEALAVTGTSPLELTIEDLSAAKLRIWLGVPEGANAVVRQRATLAVSISYRAQGELDVAQGNCVHGG